MRLRLHGVMCRCQPFQLRTSYSSSPVCCLAGEGLSSTVLERHFDPPVSPRSAGEITGCHIRWCIAQVVRQLTGLNMSSDEQPALMILLGQRAELRSGEVVESSPQTQERACRRRSRRAKTSPT